MRAGASEAKLIADARFIDWDDIAKAKTIGISAGASAPEVLVDEVIAAISANHDTTVEDVIVAEEDITFKLPSALKD